MNAQQEALYDAHTAARRLQNTLYQLKLRYQANLTPKQHHLDELLRQANDAASKIAHVERTFGLHTYVSPE